jgi:hypothetical protein
VTDTVIRLHYRKADGKIEDAQEDYGIESFAGFLPAVGDMILNPGVPTNLDRNDRNNRRIWTVVQRVFNPRDNHDYVALIVEERIPSENEDALL